MSLHFYTLSRITLIFISLSVIVRPVFAKPLMNEFVLNHTGADAHEYIEIFGESKTNYSNLAILEIEGDGNSAGIIENIFPVGTTNSAGFWTTDFQFSRLENGTLTLLLVRDFSGTTGMDLDNNNDGVLDSRPWAELIDSVAVIDSGSSDRTYTEVVLNQNYDGVPFTVGGASRIPNGIDTDETSNWQRNDFNFADNAFTDALNTPNSSNSVQSKAIHKTIMQIQGRGHLSPWNGQLATIKGIVTAVAFNGLYLQDADGDKDTSTSNGIFVFTNSGSAANVGDEVSATGVINESIPGGTASGNLSITQIFRPSLKTLSTGNSLPSATMIGQSGRIPPNERVIDMYECKPAINLNDPADASAKSFNPQEDGIDFYESLEAMLVTVEKPSAVSPLRTFNYFSSEIFALANGGVDVAPEDALNSRGGIELQPHKNHRGDHNPERVQIQFDRILYGEPPLITLGDKLTDVTGVVGYSFGNYEINAIQSVNVVPVIQQPETTELVGGSSTLSIASYNVLNLSATAADDAQRSAIAAQIVNNLRLPDVIALQEIQDNNGETNDGTVDASQTLQALVEAIVVAGGAEYSFCTVNPKDGMSGGALGSNIRNAYLYNSNRIELLDLVSLTPEVLVTADSSNPNAFSGTRDPLLAKFAFNGAEITIINNHLTSRFGSTPIFGAIQPFFQAGEINREAQVGALNEFVDNLLTNNKSANIVVLGDLNTFQWTNDLKYILTGKLDKNGKNDKKILHNLVDTLEDDAVYTFNFDGNSQVLDHIFVTKSLKEDARFDIVHVNTDFPRIDNSTASDHEPVISLFKIDNKIQ